MIKFAHGRAVVAGAVCLLLATVSVVAGVVRAQAAATGAGWRVADVYGSGVQNYDPSWPGGLAVPTRSAGWMVWVGCDWPCDPGNPISVVEHWSGHGWARVPASQLHGMEPGLVTASSASDAWLFGLFPNSRQDGALHWNGRSWAQRAVPAWLFHANGAGEVDPYLADFGPASLWVFSLGGYIGEKSAYAARYSNGRWTKSFLPGIPSSAAAISPNDIWVLGQPLSGASTEMLMHWNGRKWSASRFPKQPVAGFPIGLTAVGANDMWVAWSPANPGLQEYLLHWNGHQWSKVALPAGRTGYLFAGDGNGGLWVSGFGPGPADKQIFLHRSSAGRWSSALAVPLRAGESPGNVRELARIPGTRSLWAVGNVFSPGGGTELNRVAIWRYDA